VLSIPQKLSNRVVGVSIVGHFKYPLHARTDIERTTHSYDELINNERQVEYNFFISPLFCSAQDRSRDLECGN
jgi:hypothetical protein